MLVDLARRHDLGNVRAAEISELLGPHTCYVNYEDEPCYAVELRGGLHYLAMPVAHSGRNQGHILRATLTADFGVYTHFITGC